MENEIYRKENYTGVNLNGSPQPNDENSRKPEIYSSQSLLSPREILNEAWSLYKLRFKIFLGVALIPSLILILLFALFVILGFFSLGLKSTILNYLLIVVFVFIFIIAIFLQFWGRAALIYAIKDSGENIGIKESFRRGKGKIYQVFIVSLLSGLITMGGFLLFGIPGIIFLVWFTFAMFVVIEEDLKGMNVLLKCREYVRGYWWKVFWRNLYIGGIVMAIGLVFKIFESMFSFLNLPALENLISLVNVIVVVILAPLTTIYQYLVYKNIKAIKGDFAFTPSRSSKIKLIIIGIVGSVLGVLMAIAILPLINNLYNESHTYVDTVVPIIVNSWDSQELISRASPEFLENSSIDEIKLFFNESLIKFGRLKEYKGSTIRDITTNTAWSGDKWSGDKWSGDNTTTATYDAQAIFEKNSATIQIQVIKTNNKWQIIAFQVFPVSALNNAKEKAINTKKDKYYTDVNEVKNLWSAGNYQEALDKADEVLPNAETDEDKAVAHYWIGLNQYKLQNYVVAESELQLAIKLDKNYAAPYVTLAAIEMDSKGNFSKALEYAEKCIALDPKYAWCYNSKGLALLSLGQNEEGIKVLEQAVSLSPDSYIFRDNLTRVKQMIEQTTTKENDISINQNDSKRKTDLDTISALMQSYKNRNGEYPISLSTIKLNEDNEVVDKIKSISSTIPTDPKPGNYYGYTSSDAKSFELTAQLENLNDLDCSPEIKSICIYKLKSDS